MLALVSPIESDNDLLESCVEIDHVLKTWPDMYREIEAGEKLHDFRRNDRSFRRGQHLLLREFDPDTQHYSGRVAVVRIGSISYGPEWGIPEGFAAFTIRRLRVVRIVTTETT